MSLSRRIKIGLWTTVAASFFLHFIIAFGMWVYQPAPTVSQTIEIRMLEPDDLTKLDSAVKDSAKQVVEQDDKAVNNEIDKNAKYLSKNNQKVEKQTAAQNHGDFQNRANRAKNPGNGGKKAPKLTDFNPKFDVAKAVRDRQEQEEIFDKDPEGFKAKRKQAKAQASPSAAQTPGETGEQVSQTVDYIRDLDPGLETMLSTREFVYYTYYARIRRQLNQFWGPKVKEKLIALYRSGRQIASSSDKVTKCLVTLDKSGKLVKVQIIGVSGIHDLDEAAVEAFKAAAPFPNPPQGIIEEDGTIRIRWDFILEV